MREKMYMKQCFGYANLTKFWFKNRMFWFSELDRPKPEVLVSKTGSSGFSGLLADCSLQRAGPSATRLRRGDHGAAAARPCSGGRAGPERAGGGAHGVFHGKAKLTPVTDGEERRRGGGATKRSGGGRSSSPGALRGDGRGRVRMGTGRGVVGDAPPAKNRRGTHRGRRTAVATELGAVVAMVD